MLVHYYLRFNGYGRKTKNITTKAKQILKKFKYSYKSSLINSITFETFVNIEEQDFLDKNEQFLEEIKALYGYPYIIDRDTIQIDLYQIPSNKIIANTINLNCSSILSLKDIHKKIECEVLNLDRIVNIEKDMLGLLLVRAKEIVMHITLSDYRDNSDTIKVIEIINKHLETNNRDVLECQQELIDAGFKHFAKL